MDYTINPRMGLPYLTGPEGVEGVVNHVLPAWDLVTGQMAAVGLLAAERHRLRTGEGRHVKLALEDVALAAMAHLGFIAEAQLGHERPRHGNYLFGAFGTDFPTRDGRRVMVVGLTGKQWKSLCRATGLAEAIDALGERLGLNLRLEGNRFLAREDIAALVRQWIAERDLATVASRFDSHGVCWGPYQSVKELVDSDDACSTANPMFTTVDQPGVGPILAPTIPLDFGDTRSATDPAPALGFHTEQVLMDVLGLSSAEYGRLRDQALVGAS